MNEIRISLTQKQTEFDKAIEKTENILYGGSKGGGKSHGLREIMLKRRIQYSKSRGVIFRKTYPELYNNHINPLLTKFPILKQFYKQDNKEITLPNGSVLMFRHCEHEKDLEKHQGVEYQDLAIEEAGEWPEHWFHYLKGSNRSSNPAIPVRCLLTGNPGGIGHKWLKRLFIDRNFREGIENPKDFAFIPAKVSDNPALMKNDPNYVNRLKLNKNEQLVKAYLEGSWDIQAGQFFDMVSRETHMCDPFEIPSHWKKMGMFDYGYNHPAAFLWLASDTDGDVYVYREYVKAGKRPEEIALDLLEYPDTLKLGSIPSGHDCWSKQAGAPSIEEKMREASKGKIILHKANIERVLGAQQVRDYLVLRQSKDGIKKPRLIFFRNCPITFDCITRMTHDDKKPEDVMKVDAEDGDPYTGDDPYDALRHGLMDRPRLSYDPKPPKRRDYYDRENAKVPSWTSI